MTAKELFEEAVRDIRKNLGREPTYTKLSYKKPTPKKYRKYRKGKLGMTYEAYIKTALWKKNRKRCRGSSCYVCGSKNDLTVHHRTYKSLGNEKSKHLVMLCWSCHKETHDLSLNEKDVPLYNAHKVLKTLKSLEV